MQRQRCGIIEDRLPRWGIRYRSEEAARKQAHESWYVSQSRKIGVKRMVCKKKSQKKADQAHIGSARCKGEKRDIKIQWRSKKGKKEKFGSRRMTILKEGS